MKSPASKDLNDLWNLLKQGDASAFGEIYGLYLEDLLNYGNKLTADVELLKDCIQNVFVELWKYRATVANVSNPKFYLFKSLRNKIVRVNTAIPIFLTNKNLDDLFELNCVEMPDYSLLRSEEEIASAAMILRLMNKLTARQREAIYLHFYHNLSYKEMAHIMNMNYQSVLNLIQRSLKIMRQDSDQLPMSSVLMLVMLLASNF